MINTYALFLELLSVIIPQKGAIFDIARGHHVEPLDLWPQAAVLAFHPSFEVRRNAIRYLGFSACPLVIIMFLMHIALFDVSFPVQYTALEVLHIRGCGSAISYSVLHDLFVRYNGMASSLHLAPALLPIVNSARFADDVIDAFLYSDFEYQAAALLLIQAKGRKAYNYTTTILILTLSEDEYISLKSSEVLIYIVTCFITTIARLVELVGIPVRSPRSRNGCR